MATVRILNNRMNPLGWRVGDTVEITKEQGVESLLKMKMVELAAEEKEGKTTSDPLLHMCPTCGKTFSVKVALLGHQRSHLKEGVR